MTNILEHSYSILRFNYGIVFFVALVIMCFFVITIFKIFSDRIDFNNIINATNKICVKFDYNGIILDYNNEFLKLVSLPKTSVKSKDIFSLLSFDSYDEMMDKLFNNKAFDEQSVFVCNVTSKENSVKKISFKGIQNTNFFGAVVSYILIGTDVTLSDKIKVESEYNRKHLETLNAEYRFAEEELKRNFKQIHDTQEEIEGLKKRHKIFIDNIPLGVIQYDFSTRQLNFSAELLKFFIPNANTANIHSEEALNVIYNFVKKESVYDLVSSIYDALAKGTINFYTEVILTNNFNMPFRFTLIYDDGEPSYIYAITTFNNL